MKPMLFALAVCTASVALAAPGDVVVKVEGESITESDVEFLMVLRGIPESRRAAAAEAIVELAIEQQLARSFLAEKKVEVPDKDLTAAVARLKRLIKRGGKDPDEILKKYRLTKERLDREVGLPLAWQLYFERVTTNDLVRKHFADHKAEFDGTTIRARQIFLKGDAKRGSKADEKIRDQLTDIRKQIEAGKATFADAAGKSSQSPSGKKGGDMGWFAYSGTVPVSITRVVFGLKKDEMAGPFRTAFGWHLIQLTDRKPGEESLEDVRPLVLRVMSRKLWKKSITARRQTAKIEWVIKPEELKSRFTVQK